jgi:hypothetical protein
VYPTQKEMRLGQVLPLGINWVPRLLFIEQSRLGTHAPIVELRRIAGLGINVTDAYRNARCYLKGLSMLLNPLELMG